ncbi:transcriptional regulator domain-containing protein [Sphingomonas kyeonggiensis]|uniref:transcriptional regulator domain-containing protein n=1 Tax=Sphingomonas kyeonggiensis TaxID=1268553 RepID=UPI0027D8F3E8|nr:DUF6499 domain-containing protein [Sphingomonas kyeonggiensis]
MGEDWRDAESYRPLLALDRHGFAWEFLRRNPAYRAESAAPSVLSRSRLGGSLEHLHAPAGGAARWGLWFPGGAGMRRAPCADTLARRA